jgi:hypothetical protein
MVDPAVKAYRQRWQAVEEVELQEQRSASVATRWQQLNAILRLAIGLGLKLEADEQEKMVIYQRWARLKGAQ